VTPSTPRLAAITAGCALALATLGWAWEVSRFGWSADSGATRLQADVQRRFDSGVRRVEALANRVAHDPVVAAQLSTSPDRSDALFSRLIALARTNAAIDVSATVHTAAGPAGAYRVAAWSDGPAGDLTSDQIVGPARIFVAVGPAGLRLVSARPIESTGRRLGVVTTEAVIASAPPVGGQAEAFVLETSYGPVPVATYPTADGGRRPNAFVLRAPSGEPLLEVGHERTMLSEGRQVFRRRVLAVSVLPLFVLLLPIAARLQARRTTSALGPWAGWTVALAALAVVAAAGLAGIAALLDASPEITQLIAGAAAFAVASTIALAAWWRRWPLRTPAHAPVRFVAEQAVAGLLLAGLLRLLAQVLADTTDPAQLSRWHLPIFSTDAAALASLGGSLLLQVALGWTAASVLALSAMRWKLGWRRTAGWLAAALWLAPVVALLAVPPAVPTLPALTAAGTAALFGLFAGTLRHWYRHASQAARLLLFFGGLLLPIVATYPLAAHARERAVRRLIEQDYGPATAAAQRAEGLYGWLTAAQREIDQMPGLAARIPRAETQGRVDSQAAFRVWRQTSLSRHRVTSEIELFDGNRRLASRFALNVPQFEAAYQTGAEIWSGSSCAWDAYAELSRFGAEERWRLHAERGFCDGDGRIIGAIVIHELPDYRVLPFVSSANPYFEVIAQPADAVAPRVPDLQVVVYGWNLQPTYASGRVTWQLPVEVDDRLYTSRQPFWAELPADRRRYQVYFLSDRAGIYAVGYPKTTLFQHLSRLSELFAVTAGFFVLLVAGLAAYAPFARGPASRGPLRAVVEEIRTSFYRKLFLFFVLAAVGPVLLFAAAFSSYTMARFSADIESEAASVVAVARRVFEELLAAGRQSDSTPVSVGDDVMVWIQQVIDQDVNLYDGPNLVATSQRDLFASGLLPTRTPASVYRAIALHRAPTYVALDRIGNFQMLVAAAPVTARGKDAVLSVPLATRQREVEREIEDLNRGVLVGAVVVVLFAAGLGASVAGRVSDPVSRLTRATRLIAAGRLDIRLVADTADELGRLVEDFNGMAATLAAQRGELARTHQLKAWAEMARQVAHEIKNPLTPIQLAAEHLRHVHQDKQRPLGPVFDQCVDTILKQVRLLRHIAAEFSSFGMETPARPSAIDVTDLLDTVVEPYRPGVAGRIRIEVTVGAGLPTLWIDRVLIARALTNLIENAIQAMPGGGTLTIAASSVTGGVAIVLRDTGTGMEPEAVRRAFEPYFSTKTAGSGLGLANARRNVEACGGRIEISSTSGAGTTMTVTLPVEPPPAGESASPPGR
jgi:signal transduction histidine kinase